MKRKNPGESGAKLLYNSYKTRAKSRGYSFNISFKKFKYLTKENCFYCGSVPSQVKKQNNKNMSIEGVLNSTYIYNGLDRINNSFGYSLRNCVPCCKICNMAKYNITQEEFFNWINALTVFRIKNVK